MIDVVVIGAGPAGCRAASVLARRGCSVVLVEKKRLPRNKSCSGVLVARSLALLEESVPDWVLRSPGRLKGMYLTDAESRCHCFPDANLHVDRSRFDHWLATSAVMAGARLIEGTRVLCCREEDDHVRVVLEHGDLEARAVVICDGAAGTLGGKHAKIHTFQSFCKGKLDLDPCYFHAFLQSDLSEYDAWCSMRDGRWAIGVAVLHFDELMTYHHRFKAYLKESHGACLAPAETSERWLMPRAYVKNNVIYGHGRILFAGEASGFLNPMGEGISCALASGKAAAEAILQCGFSPEVEFVDAYRQLVAPVHAYMRRQWDLVAAMSPRFADGGPA